MARTDRCVVRNQAYRGGEFSIRERHNERKNEAYGNGDIMPERSCLNVHFKECGGTYKQAFDRMVEDGTISLRGLGKDPKVFDELVFDVNTSYFDRGGGYEYAKEFFAEAYKLAVKEAGGEQYILSAVMHADERNKAESERLGRDVFHYHLHVVYVPVVTKEVYFRKNNKNPELAGKLKEVIAQVSHSKKWPRQKQLDESGEVKRNENGKAILVNAYSLLQDRFYEHMRAAGFTDFERGERGSTREHLSDLEYKTRQEAGRAAALADKADTLGGKVQKQQERLALLDEKTEVRKQEAAAFSEIDSMAKKTLGGNVQLSPSDWKQVSSLAKEGVKSRGIIKELKEKIGALLREISGLKSRLERYGDGQSITDAMRFHQAMQRAPRRMKEVIKEILGQPPEQQRDTRQPKQKGREQER